MTDQQIWERLKDCKTMGQFAQAVQELEAEGVEFEVIAHDWGTPEPNGVIDVTHTFKCTVPVGPGW